MKLAANLHRVSPSHYRGWCEWLLAVLSKLIVTRIPAEVTRGVERALLVARANTAHPVFRSAEMIGHTEPQLQELIAYAPTVPAFDLNLNATE